MNDNEEQQLHQNRIEWNRIFDMNAVDRTIRITYIESLPGEQFAGCNAAYDVYEYFKQFGEVQSTQHFGRYGKENYVLIEFESKAIADQMAMRSRFMINSDIFKVESLEKTDILIYDLQCIDLGNSISANPPKIDSPKNILNSLNDDCIRLVFRKISNIRDFYSISKVCKRFNEIAKEIFPSKIRRDGVDFNKYRLGTNHLDELQIENFLRDFGSSIESLEFSETYMESMEDKSCSNTILKIIHKYCKNLIELDLRVSGIKNQTVAEIQSLLSKLNYLHLRNMYGSDFGSFNDFITSCSQLESLKLSCFCHASNLSIPNVNFPKLIEFQMESKNIEFDAFLECNPQIEKIVVPRFFYQNMPKIKELTLCNENESITEEQGLHLRNMNISTIKLDILLDDSIINIFRLKNIHHLTLNVSASFNENHLISLAQSAPYIKRISIYHNGTYNINFDVIKQMLRYANNLVDLKIEWPENFIQHFNENDYNDILKFVKNRSNHIKLYINLTNITTFFDNTNGLKTKLMKFEMDSDYLCVLNYCRYSIWN